MNSYPVTSPSRLEKMLFDAGLVVEVPQPEIYDIMARTSIQRSWQNPDICKATPDICDPRQWNDKLHACMRGEFFVHVLKGCRRVLDVGCGEGWPSLYLARSISEVVGLEISAEHIALARNSAKLMGLDNMRFEVCNIEKLPFPDNSFDGVCFGGNVFTYCYDSREMLGEICRVLKPDGAFAFEQWPVPPKPAWEKISWFIDGGPPILHYGAGIGLYGCEYFIYIKPDSEQGKWLMDLAERMSGELSREQREACEKIKGDIEEGNLDIVEKALVSKGRSLGVDEFPAMLIETGFRDVNSWALPNAVTFAKTLQQEGILAHMQPEDLLPCLRALVVSSQIYPGWVTNWVTCRKG